MQASDIAALLGLPADSPRVQGQLGRFDIHDRPSVKHDLNDVDGPIVETQDWLINNSAGVEFGFEDQGSWEGIDETHRGRGPMLLTQMYLYGYHPDMEPYQEAFPFGINLSDNRETVRQKLAKFETTRRSYVRDTWELHEFRFTVSYAEDGSGIGFVLCELRPSPLPPLDGPMPALPDLQDMIGALGQAWGDPKLRQHFVPLGIDWNTREAFQGREADFRRSFGFELGFLRPSAKLVLASVVFYRDRQFEARAWSGALPFGIHFDDSPQLALEKGHDAPAIHEDDTLSGFALWHRQNCSVHVKYSTIENLILEVRIIAPGIWDYLHRA